MGIQYFYYLEQKKKGEWIVLTEDCICCTYFLGEAFFNRYSTDNKLPFNKLNKEYREEYQQKYDNASESDKEDLCAFYEMNLLKMFEDYNDDIHECFGIVSRSAVKLFVADYNCDYEPTVIDEEIYAKFSDKMKENYEFFAWDRPGGEFYYLYELMPTINAYIDAYGLKMDSVRLVCRVSC